MDYKTARRPGPAAPGQHPGTRRRCRFSTNNCRTRARWTQVVGFGPVANATARCWWSGGRGGARRPEAEDLAPAAPGPFILPRPSGRSVNKRIVDSVVKRGRPSPLRGRKAGIHGVRGCLGRRTGPGTWRFPRSPPPGAPRPAWSPSGSTHSERERAQLSLHRARRLPSSVERRGKRGGPARPRAPPRPPAPPRTHAPAPARSPARGPSRASARPGEARAPFAPPTAGGREATARAAAERRRPGKREKERTVSAARSA